LEAVEDLAEERAAEVEAAAAAAATVEAAERQPETISMSSWNSVDSCWHELRTTSMFEFTSQSMRLSE
jgi:hypothetical protein